MVGLEVCMGGLGVRIREFWSLDKDLNAVTSGTYLERILEMLIGKKCEVH
jgi:hypothetical protein